jgi:hypothetical protein
LLHANAGQSLGRAEIVNNQQPLSAMKHASQPAAQRVFDTAKPVPGSLSPYRRTNARISVPEFIRSTPSCPGTPGTPCSTPLLRSFIVVIVTSRAIASCGARPGVVTEVRKSTAGGHSLAAATPYECRLAVLPSATTPQRYLAREWQRLEL